MSQSLKIMMVASEVFPFSKTGGLADVLGALPQALKDLGHEVVVVTPKYACVDQQRWGLREIIRDMIVPMGNLGGARCQVYEGILGRDVPIFFIGYDYFYEREGIYNDANGKGYDDNGLRFILLARASLELARRLDWSPDVVHAHDWQSALVPLYLNTLYRYSPRFAKTASILTIHNMQYQGQFSKELLPATGIGWGEFHMRSLEFHDHLNLLKGGLYHATLLSTVSKGYAREIHGPEQGFGLDGVIRDRSNDLFGIPNGIDVEVWDPAQDPHIPAHYNKDDRSGKAHCKRELQRHFGLPVRDDVPLLVMISRLVHQKGIDVAAEAMPHLLQGDIQIIVLGTGERRWHEYFHTLSCRYPHRFAVHIGYSDPLAHFIEAGADFFLMPSRFEPCGLNQLYSLRYGTVPIVRATGGLEDTVEAFDEKENTGTGFKFQDLTPSSIINTVQWALHIYRKCPQAMQDLITRGMARCSSWRASSESYEQLYRAAMARKKSSFHSNRM